MLIKSLNNVFKTRVVKLKFLNSICRRIFNILVFKHHSKFNIHDNILTIWLLNSILIINALNNILNNRVVE